MKRRVMTIIVVLLSTISILFSQIPVVKAKYYIRDRMKIDYESAEAEDEFSADIEKLNVSYLAGNSRVKVVAGEKAIHGNKSLAINCCDMRWWGLDAREKRMNLTFSLSFDDCFNNVMSLSVGSEQPTYAEKVRRVLKITKVGSIAQVCDWKDSVLAELELHRVYNFTVSFNRTSNLYSIKVNGNVIGKDIELDMSIYSITSFIIAVNENRYSPVDNPYIIIDDIKFTTEGKDTPQEFSTQETGELPTIKIPIISDEKIKVFVNDTKLKMEKEPVIDGDVLYLDVESLAKGLGMTFFSTAEGFEIKNDNVTVSAVLGSNVIKINGNEVSINNPITEIDGKTVVSPNFINEAFNAKVWWDKESGIFAVTIGEYKDNGLLVSLNGKLFMNGEPYYEISYNKFDLFYQILAGYVPSNEFPRKEHQFEAAEAAIKQLSEAGFTSVRAFMYSSAFPDLMYNEDHQRIYFEAMDKTFDLLDKYNMKAVVCLGLIEKHLLEREYVEGEGWTPGDEDLNDLVADSESASRQNVYKYIDMFVSRYKDRDSVLMWEIKNEANLEADIGNALSAVRYSLLQEASFYADCAEKIRSIDDKHLISGGDAVMRKSQWNLLKDTMNGVNVSWKTDTVEENFKAIALLNEKLDVVSLHVYGLGCTDTREFIYIDEKGNEVEATWELFQQHAKNLQKTFYNGETNPGLNSNNENFAELTQSYIDAIIDAGVQLTHWWTFRSDRQGFEDGYEWRCESGVLWDSIVAANKKIKEVYVVNVAGEDNTDTVWEDKAFEVIDIANVAADETKYVEVVETTPIPNATEIPTKNEEQTHSSCSSVLMGGTWFVIMIVGSSIIFLIKKRR